MIRGGGSMSETVTGNEAPIRPCTKCGFWHTYNEGVEKGCYE